MTSRGRHVKQFVEEENPGVRTRRPAHSDNFAFLRLIAAIAVIYGHAFPLTGHVAPGLMANGIQTIAVKIFFVISGYLITESWLRDPHPVRYALRRILRIFPALVVLCVVTVFAVGPLLTTLMVADYFRNSLAYMYFWNILMSPFYSLPGVFSGNIYPNAVNGSLWTLPVELSMYILMPLTLMTVRWNRMFFSLCAILLCVASLIVIRGGTEYGPIVFYGTNIVSALDVAPYFFVGALARLLDAKRYLNLQYAFVACLIAPFVPNSDLAREAVLLVLLPYAVLSFGYAYPPRFAAVAKIGDLSYGTYLYGFLMQQIAVSCFEFGRTPMSNFLLAVVPTLICAALSWKYIEKPMLAIKPSRWSPTVRLASRQDPSSSDAAS